MLQYGYHLKGTKATLKPSDPPSEDTRKGKTKTAPKPSKKSAPEVEVAEDVDEVEEDPTKEVMKSFLVSVVTLVSGLTRDKKKAREKKKKEQN